VLGSERARRRASSIGVALGCAACFLGALLLTRGVTPFPPDAAHNAMVARSLARGEGFTLEILEYHFGRVREVEHVAEMHGILQPIALAGLFTALGEERSLSPVPGFAYVALTGWVAFVYARRRFGGPAGLVACLLTLGSAVLWFWAWFGTDDAGFAFWFLLAIFALDLAREERTELHFALAGLAAAAALLQKQSGLVLLAPMLGVVAGATGVPVRIRLRWAAIWAAPWALALACYLARNLAASGQWMFRFGSIDWIYKSRGLEAFFAVHDETPALSEVLRSLGVEGVASIVSSQLDDFARVALSFTPALRADPLDRLMSPAFLAPLGFAALALHAWRCPGFAGLVALSIAASVAFVCGLWHFELRFFTPLIPLLAIALAGALAPGAAARRTHALRRIETATTCIGFGVAALSVGLFTRSLAAIPIFAAAPPCEGGLAWIRRETAPSDRILSFDPWAAAWVGERAAIVIPSGPRRDVEKVVRWYRPGWLVLQPVVARNDRTIREMVANPSAGFATSLAYADRECSVHRIVSSTSDTP
jgi:4-amino-4-deoxy-L-arabinose transferase-like glycosyltransferase